MLTNASVDGMGLIVGRYHSGILKPRSKASTNTLFDHGWLYILDTVHGYLDG